MDLSTLDTSATAEAGAAMEVVHPTTGAALLQDDGAPITVTLAGEDSDRYRKAERRASNRRLATAASGRRVRATAEALESDRLDLLVACTIDWDGIGFDGGEKACTPDNVRAAYQKLPWLREQAEAFIMDRANFLKV